MKKIIYLYITFCVVLTACGGSDDGPGPDPDPDPDPMVVAPSLVFPENNSVCTEAKDLTGNQGDPNRTYTISFRWTGVVGDKYELSLENQADNTVRTENITAANTNVVLDVNQIIPGANYTWKVTASKDGTTDTAASTEQTFTAAGIAAISFVPQAATPNNPLQNASLPSTTTMVALDWSAADDDNDITAYDVYFGEDNPPATLVETITDNTVTTRDVTVTSNTLYFWRIVTKDAAGNESGSAVFKFAVQ